MRLTGLILATVGFVTPANAEFRDGFAARGGNRRHDPRASDGAD